MMKKIFILLFLTYFCTAYSQNTGDFRSRDWTGDIGAQGWWTDYRSWQIYDGSNWVDAVSNQYPGQTAYQGSNVTIQCIANAPVRIDKGTYAIGGQLTINGTLNIVNNNGTVDFTGVAKDVDLIGGQIVWLGNGNLAFPLGTVISISGTACGTGLGLIGPANCNASQLLTIGGVKYTSCNGGGGVQAGTFDAVNTAGGSFLALIDSQNRTLCKGESVGLHAYTQGLTAKIGTISYQLTADPNNPAGGVTGFTASNGTVSNTATPPTYNQLDLTQNLTFMIDGQYKFILMVTYGGGKDLKTQMVDVVIEVGQESVYSGTWSKGVPSKTNRRKARIASDYSTAAGSFDACSCEVAPKNTLTITGDTYVSVRDEIINNGIITVKTDGNLIQINGDASVNTGNDITVERETNLRYNSGTAVDYVYWSSPVVGQNLQTFSPGTLLNYIFQYNEANDKFIKTGDIDFEAGKGYAIRAEQNLGVSYTKPYKFSGKPNNGNYYVTIKKSQNSGAVEHGYNLLGNPYPSNISFDELYNLNTSSIKPTVWFWTNKIYTPNQEGSSYDGSNYVAYTKGGSNNPGVNGIIKVGQGFIVQKTALGDGTFTFKNMNGSAPVRVADAGTFYQRGTMNRYWLALTSPDEMINNQLIGYFDGAADGYDGIYDAKALAITPDLFYSVVDDQRLLVQGKAPVFRSEDRVALGANLYREGNYTITLQQPEGIFAGRQAVYLKDHETGRMTNLSEQPYTFAAKSGMSEGRFEVFYQPQAKPVASESAKDGVIVYRDGTLYVIKSRETISLIEVYDGAGRMVHTERPRREEISVNMEHYPKGVFFLKIHTGGSVITKKVLH